VHIELINLPFLRAGAIRKRGWPRVPRHPERTWTVRPWRRNRH
jgi:hypothetical protein